MPLRPVPKPRVSLDAHHEPATLAAAGDPISTSPGCDIELTWDQGDERRALGVLDSTQAVIRKRLVDIIGPSDTETMRDALDGMIVAVDSFLRATDGADVKWIGEGFVEQGRNQPGIFPLRYSQRVLHDGWEDVLTALRRVDERLPPAPRKTT